MQRKRRYIFSTLAILWLYASWLSATWYAEHKTTNYVTQSTESLESDSLALFQAFEERLNYLSALPVLISHFPDMGAVTRRYAQLPNPSMTSMGLADYWRQKADLSAVNNHLKQLVDELQVDIAFILNAEGYCIASSNSDTSESFVGTLYKDRQYYKAAIAGESAHQYAVGRKTNIPGIFYSAPIRLDGKPSGVMVVKSNITDFQGLLAPYHVFLTDNHDVVVLASEPGFLQQMLDNARFRSLSSEVKQQLYKRTVFPTLGISPWNGNHEIPLLRLSDISSPVLMTERQISDGDLIAHVYQPLPEVATIVRERWVFAIFMALAGFSVLSLLYQLGSYLQNLRQSKSKAEAEREKLHETLSERETQLETILDNLPLMVVARDPTTQQVISSNKATQSVLGLESALPAGKTYQESLDTELAGFLTTADAQEPGPGTARTAREFITDGHVIQTQNLTAKDSEGHPLLLIDMVEDITQKRRDEAEIRRLAFIDTLTGLNNRTAFKLHLQRTIDAAMARQQFGGMILVDLDAFKQVNDRLGHSVGDQLLVALADRLKTEASHQVYMARLASDEFVVLIDSHSTTREEAAQLSTRLAHTLLRKLTQPYLLAEHTLHVTASLGVALFGQGEATSAEVLLIRTDAAMYEAKRKQRGMIQFFDESTQKYLNDQADLTNRLRGALSQSVFEQYYQPQVDRTGAVVGVEALLRWRDPVLGQVPPSVFIPLAEALHLIVDIDRWVLKQACCVLGTWKTNPVLSNVVISVNVSAEYFSQDGFVDEVCNLLREFDVPPARIMIELTEGTVVEDTEANLLKMQALHAAGLTIAIDDFGTGNSSLAYLRRFEVDQLKIDQRFVKEMIEDKRSLAITESIIRLAHDLGYQTLAEGVEEQSQRDLLETLGCQLFQGYLFSKPMPLADCEAYILRSTR